DRRVPARARPGRRDRAQAGAARDPGGPHRAPVVSAWRTVQLARHPERPYALDYVRGLAQRVQELHGDRLSADDPALVGGLAWWGGRGVMFLGQQKGRTLRERAARNFGMLHPEGYRKAMRLARLAARFGLPVVCLVDTPGAFPGAGAEEGGIGSAIG